MILTILKTSDVVLDNQKVTYVWHKVFSWIWCLKVRHEQQFLQLWSIISIV